MGLFEKKRLFTYIEPDDTTPIASLPVLDQIRLLIKQLTANPELELQNEDYAMTEVIKLKANLQDFLYKATAPIRKGDKSSVVVTVDSQFRPVLNEVLNSQDIQDYYKVEVAQPKIEYDIDYDIMVRLTVRTK